MAITVLVNVRESSEARGLGKTNLEQLPRNAATLLTGAVGMLLLFTYLPDRIPGHQPLQPDFTHPLRSSSTPLTSTVLLMEAA